VNGSTGGLRVKIDLDLKGTPLAADGYHGLRAALLAAQAATPAARAARGGSPAGATGAMAAASFGEGLPAFLAGRPHSGSPA
jgi:hypothetical protein